MPGGVDLLRVVLVDDERCVLEELEFLLQGRAEIAGKFTSSIAAVENIADLAPDAVLLDVEMPGMNGLETAFEILAILPKVAILFITSFGHYAVDAFELNAVDYLMKPVQPDRLDKALERIIRRLAEGRTDEATLKRNQWLNDSLTAKRRTTASLWRGHHLEIIPLAQIACCFIMKGQRNVSVVAEGQVLQSTEGLIQFVKNAGLSQLLRCNRSFYINPAFITKLEPGEGGTLNAYIPGVPERIPISRKYRSEVMKALKLINKS
jgi:DNA-binding LytR/AlgR family response regulator